MRVCTASGHYLWYAVGQDRLREIVMRVIFKFKGGPLDGKTVSGDAGEPGEAQRYYVLTYHGRLGQRFRTASEYAVNILVRKGLQAEQPHRFQPHYYEVIDRIDNGDVLLVRTEYVPAGGGR